MRKIISNPKIFYYLFLGSLIGAMAFFSLPAFLTLGLAIYLIFALFRINAITIDEKRFITWACSLAIGLRFMVSLLILFYGKYSNIGSDVFGDAMTYEGVGAYIRELASGMLINNNLWGDNLLTVSWLRQVWRGIDFNLGGAYSIPLVAYWYGFFHTLWGFSFIAPKMLNGLMWVTASYWIYIFFRERFTTQGIKTGLLIVLFLPSAMVFSASGLKDSLLFFLATSVIFSSHKLESCKHRWYAVSILLIVPLLQKVLGHIGISRVSFFLITLIIISVMMTTWSNRFWPLYGPLIVCNSIFLSVLREYVWIIVIIFSLLIAISQKISLKKVILAAILIIIIISVLTGGNFLVKVDNRLKGIISTAVLQNYNTAYGNTGYHVYPERLYPHAGSTITSPELFFSFLNGLRYVFLEPALWTFRQPISLLMFPETLFMWFLVPFMLIGILAILRIGAPLALPTLAFLFVMTCLLVFGQGNIGSLVRIRLMVMPWYFMLAGIGLNCAYFRIFKTK